MILQESTVVDGRYSILALLGEGGMGTVYRAVERSSDRPVALKLLHPSLVADAESVTRFKREAEICSNLSHTHIAMFYRFGIWDEEMPYIAMEFVEGKSLRDVLNTDDRLEWQRAISIIAQAAEAMAHAHKMGFVHRDLKPNNILLVNEPTPEFVKVLDFGLARLIGGEGYQKLTQTGALVGSVFYMSPEQCGGKPVDSRSDIYALGCVLYELLTGAPPFTSDNPIGLLHLHATEQHKPLRSYPFLSNCPGALDHVISAALAKDAADRYQTMHEFREDLLLVASGKQPVRQVVKKGTYRDKAAGLRAKRLAASLVVLLLLSGLIWGFVADPGLSYFVALRVRQSGQLKDAIGYANYFESIGKPKAALQISMAALDNATRTQPNSVLTARLAGDEARRLFLSGEVEAAEHRIITAIGILSDKRGAFQTNEADLLSVMETLALIAPTRASISTTLDRMGAYPEISPALEVAIARARLSINQKLFDNECIAAAKLATILAQQHRDSEARRYLQQAEVAIKRIAPRLSANRAAARAKMAHAYILLQDIKQAQKTVSDMKADLDQLDSEMAAELLMNLAICFTKSHQADLALALAQLRTKYADPVQDEGGLAICEALGQEQENTDKAIKLVESYLSKHGGEAKALALYAHLLLEKKRYNDALEVADQLLLCDPKSKEWSFGIDTLRRAYVDLGEPEKAVPKIEKALRGKPLEQHFEQYLTYVDVLQRCRKFDNMALLVRKILDAGVSGKTKRAFMQYYISALASSDQAKLRAYLSAEKEYFAANPATLCEALYRLGDYDECYQIARATLNSNLPETERIRCGRAIVECEARLHRNGQGVDAVVQTIANSSLVQMEKAAEMIRLAHFLKEQEQYEQSIDLCLKILRGTLTPEQQFGTLELLSFDYLMSGQFEPLLNLYKDRAADFKSRALTRQSGWIVCALIQRGRLSEAEKVLVFLGARPEQDVNKYARLVKMERSVFGKNSVEDFNALVSLMVAFRFTPKAPIEEYIDNAMQVEKQLSVDHDAVGYYMTAGFILAERQHYNRALEILAEAETRARKAKRLDLEKALDLGKAGVYTKLRRFAEARVSLAHYRKLSTTTDSVLDLHALVIQARLELEEKNPAACLRTLETAHPLLSALADRQSYWLDYGQSIGVWPEIALLTTQAFIAHNDLDKARMQVEKVEKEHAARFLKNQASRPQHVSDVNAVVAQLKGLLADASGDRERAKEFAKQELVLLQKLFPSDNHRVADAKRRAGVR